MLLLCLLRLAYGDPALWHADGVVLLTEDLLSDLLGRDTAGSAGRTDTPSPDSATLMTAERSPSYTELELTVPSAQPQVRPHAPPTYRVVQQLMTVCQHMVCCVGCCQRILRT